MSEYEIRKKAAQKWPGEINKTKSYVANEISHMVPDFTHVFEAEIITEVFQQVGFSIEYAGYYTRPGLPNICRFDGRENLGIVAIKIR